MAAIRSFANDGLNLRIGAECTRETMSRPVSAFRARQSEKGPGKAEEIWAIKIINWTPCPPAKAKGTPAIPAQSTSRLAGDKHISLLNKT